MPFRYGQFSFAGGEYSPNIYARVDIQKYATGLKTCKNFFVHPHGGASNRPGFALAAAQGDETKKARVFPHVFSRDQAYILEVGENYARFYTDQGQIVVSGAAAYNAGTAYVVNDYVTFAAIQYRCIQDGTGNQPDISPTFWTAQDAYEIYLPYTESDLPLIKFTGSADVIYVTHPDYQTRTISRFGETDWRLELFEPEDGPFTPENIIAANLMTASATTGAGIDITTVDDTFLASNVGSLFKLTHFIEGQTASQAFSSVTNGAAITCFTTWRLITHGTWTGKITVQRSIDAGATWQDLRSFSSANDFNPNTFGTEDVEVHTEPFLVRVIMYQYSSGTANIDLTTDAFFQSGVVKMQTFVSTTAMTADVITSIGSTDPTAVWAEGSWSARRGYPAESTFHQDRLVLAATYFEPMTQWFSRGGQYISFGRNASTLLDTDSISINLLSRQLNAINGLVPLRDLIAFTTASEWNISAADQVLTPLTITANPESYRGSNGIDPVVVGNQLIYVQANGSVIRNFGYEFSSDSFNGTDLRILAEHLFSGFEIVDMAYQQDNDSIVWFVRDDGVLLAMTYLFEQEVIAWTQHDTDGEIESCAVVPADGFDELWITVKRGNRRFVERMVQRLVSTDPQDQFFVDSGISIDNPLDITAVTQADPGVITTSVSHGFSNGDFVDISDIVGMTELNTFRYLIANVTATTFELTEEDSGDNIDTTAFTAYVSGGKVRKAFLTFTGLDHLEGEFVTILGNGEVYPLQQVVSGEITLTRACSKVHVGLPYTCDFETLNIEKAVTDGTIQGVPVKIAQVTFRVLDSRGGFIGPNFDTLYEGFIPERERLGLAPALFSGDVRLGLGAGYEDGGRVAFRQVDPLPVTITAVIPEIRVGK